MKKSRRLMDLLPLMLLWLVLSVIGWGFVFTRITTYAPEEKMALLCPRNMWVRSSEEAMDVLGAFLPQQDMKVVMK